VYLSSDGEGDDRAMLCQGLKRVVKVEFDESGNPKEVSVAKE